MISFSKNETTSIDQTYRTINSKLRKGQLMENKTTRKIVQTK